MNIKKILVLTLFLVAIIGIIAPINATDTQNIDKTILSKEKVTKYKITWNANGGKIGTKKTVTTSVTKGSKIGKVTTPKRYSYSFTGWYTAKTGGKKVTTTTKMPTKNINLYAHWKKGSSSSGGSLSTAAKSLVGTWTYGNINAGKNSGAYADSFTFKSDGTYVRKSLASGSYYSNGGGVIYQKGKWSASSSTISLKDRTETYTLWSGKVQYQNKKYSNQNQYYVLETKEGKKGIKMSTLSLADAKTSFFLEKQ